MERPVPKRDLSDVDYLRFSGLVREKSGLEIPEVRRPDLEKAVLQSMSELSIADPETLFHYLTDKEEGSFALEGLIARVTVGETYFFRNRPQFEALENHILPDLIAKRRAIKRLRIWSAGCASGEEPYSLAILIRRLIPDLADWNVFILATDINRFALEKAQKGEFGTWSFREAPPEVQANYFSQSGHRFTIRPVIRSMVTFAYLNLVEDSYPSMLTNTQVMDLILCRNVLIYFNEATNRRVVERLHASLNKMGWLIVGHAEPSQTVFRNFLVHNFPGTIIYQKPEDEEQLPASPAWGFPPASRPAPALRPVTTVRPPAPIRPRSNGSVWPAQKRPAPLPSAARKTLPPPAEVQAALALFEAGQADEALQQFTALAEAHPANAWPPFWMAKIYANRLDLDAAERWVDVALTREPLLAPAHYLRGLILQELGRLDQSLEALRSCLYADAEFLLGYFSLAGLFARLSQPQRALKTLMNLEDLLAKQDREAAIPEGDGLTVGRLTEFVAAQKELLA